MISAGARSERERATQIIDRLRALRESDAPTHGGRILSYVYDSGLTVLDALAGEAAEIARPLNGLDPTAFPSIAVMERDIVAFVRAQLHGPRRGPGAVVGTVTSGGTESCLLAVKTARDLWREQNPGDPRRPRLVTTTAVHAAFQKAARLFDLTWDPVPCREDGSVSAAAMIDRLGPDVALVVLSAPAYPTGVIDPIAEVAAAARSASIACHVDACFGGLALPWWPNVPPWDFRVRGVTSVSADLHKFGYAPKGVSVLLHRGRHRQRAQFFATTRWPGYPVVNPTLLGSRSVSPVAASWAILQYLGGQGFERLTAKTVAAAREVARTVDGIHGLRILGSPTGPSIAVVADEGVPPSERVDPHRLADAVAEMGFRLQHQPGLTQEHGVRLPHSAHLTITPVTERITAELSGALRSAADAVRGRPRATVGLASWAMRFLGYGTGSRVPGPTAGWIILRLAGANRVAQSDRGPTALAPLMALVEALPPPVSEALLAELIARVSDPG